MGHFKDLVAWQKSIDLTTELYKTNGDISKA